PEGRTRLTKTGKPTAVLHTAPHTFTTKLDAEAWLTDERRMISAGTWTPPAERRRDALADEQARQHNTFGVYARAWLAGRHHLRATTRDAYNGSIERHLIPAFGHLPLDQITVGHVRAWFAS